LLFPCRMLKPQCRELFCEEGKKALNPGFPAHDGGFPLTLPASERANLFLYFSPPDDILCWQRLMFLREGAMPSLKEAQDAGSWPLSIHKSRPPRQSSSLPSTCTFLLCFISSGSNLRQKTIPLLWTASTCFNKRRVSMIFPYLRLPVCPGDMYKVPFSQPPFRPECRSALVH